MTDSELVRLITVNLEVDCGPDAPDGTPPAAWTEFHEQVLAPRNYDGVFRQEMTHSAQFNKRRLNRAAQILGGPRGDMRGWVAPTGQGNNPTGLFLRTSTFPVAQEPQLLKVWRTPPTAVITRLAEVPEVPLVMASWHGSFCSPRGRETEWEDLSALIDKVKYGSSFIGAGDCNEYPVQEGEPTRHIDWNDPAVTDLVHRFHRALKQPDGSWKSCTFLDEMMLDAGFHDPARYVAREYGKDDALHPTAGHLSDGQGHASRIDRFYMDPWMITAVEDLNVIDLSGFDNTGTGLRKSDHDAVEVVMSRKGMVEALRRQVRPEPLFFSLAS